MSYPAFNVFLWCLAAHVVTLICMAASLGVYMAVRP